MRILHALMWPERRIGRFIDIPIWLFWNYRSFNYSTLTLKLFIKMYSIFVAMTQPASNSIIKERLHEYIESADDAHIAAIYVLLENDMRSPVQYDDETLAMLYKRVDDDLNGKSHSYSPEEFFAKIRPAK